MQKHVPLSLVAKAKTLPISRKGKISEHETILSETGVPDAELPQRSSGYQRVALVGDQPAI